MLPTSHPLALLWFGVRERNMAGNVCEWTSDWWGEYRNSHRLLESDQCCGKVVRGVSWRKQGHETRTTFRGHADPGSYADDIGFRCAK
jgi:formylglycine-generating enzyme required for sulfatase activity